MHAVLVTYENDTPVDEVRNHPDNIEWAKALRQVPGLVSKTWINDGKTFGGFYAFTHKASADAFIAGDMFQKGVVEDPSCRNVKIKHYAVLSELTAITGSTKAMAGVGKG